MFVVTRGVVATTPRGEAATNLRLNLAPHGAFRLLTCAPRSLVATAPPCLSGIGRVPTSLLEARVD